MKRLAIFARPPEVGQVKTRLSPALPPALAAGLYAALLADTLEVGRASSADERSLWWASEPLPDGPPPGFEVRAQAGADLGERLANAADALLSAPGDRVVLVGSDLPALRAAHLDEAFATLESNDLVLGPTTDGGYWLVGLSRRAREVFEGIAWSTDGVFTQTLSAAARLGLRVHALALHEDLDTPHDLARLVAAAATGGGTALGPHAAEALRRMGMLPG